MKRGRINFDSKSRRVTWDLTAKQAQALADLIVDLGWHEDAFRLIWAAEPELNPL